ncbi:MAG: branched-chain amino acid ABC transporter permease [Hyphomicrobiales bacterium]|nr:branched-chain amino acid ABC transporter permease [Hyphomicrobiales bacterium]
MTAPTQPNPAASRNVRRLSRRLVWVLALAVLVILALIPVALSGYWIRVLTGVYMMTIVTASINLMVGYAGYPAFGNVVFFGVGAYVAGIMATVVGAPPVAAIAVAALAAALYALVLGYPILRLRGGYFAIATLGINEATRLIVTNLEITGGGRGMTMPIVELSSAMLYGIIYYFMLAAMVVTVGTIAILVNRPFGFALRALRDDEDAAKVMGINTTWYKMLAWMISAFFTALAGAGWAYWIAFFEPNSAFDIMIALKAFVMMLLGGTGTILGPVTGSFLVEIFSELIWARFLNVHLLVLGVLIVVIIVLLPTGLPALLRRFSDPTATGGIFRRRQRS